LPKKEKGRMVNFRMELNFLRWLWKTREHQGEKRTIETHGCRPAESKLQVHPGDSIQLKSLKINLESSQVAMINAPFEQP
jgi:hypothetical protein